MEAGWDDVCGVARPSLQTNTPGGSGLRGGKRTPGTVCIPLISRIHASTYSLILLIAVRAKTAGASRTGSGLDR